MQTTSNQLVADRGWRAISISLKPPKDWKGLHYPKLAPNPQLLHDWHGKISIQEYCRRYEAEVLSKLDRVAVWQELHSIKFQYEGDRPIPVQPLLCCYEPPPLDSDCVFRLRKYFCHRHLVAKWLSELRISRVNEWNGCDRPRSWAGDYYPELRSISASTVQKTKRQAIDLAPYKPGDLIYFQGCGRKVIGSTATHTQLEGISYALHNEMDLGR